MSEQEYSEQEHEEALKWANSLINRFSGDDNPYRGIPDWEQTWDLINGMELIHVMSSAVDRVYVLGDIYLGTVEQVAKMSKEDVRRIIDAYKPKRGTSVSEKEQNPRDTHFAGFAEKQFQELQPDLTTLFVALGSGREHDIVTAESIIQRQMARRAYDLGCHILDNMNPIALQTDATNEEILAGIPDLTELPKEGGE